MPDSDPKHRFLFLSALAVLVVAFATSILFPRRLTCWEGFHPVPRTEVVDGRSETLLCTNDSGDITYDPRVPGHYDRRIPLRIGIASVGIVGAGALILHGRRKKGYLKTTRAQWWATGSST